MKQYRVLITDDEPRIVKFLELKLKASGYEVLTAYNGWEALEIVQSQEPDLLVLDVIMPGMDGFETLKQVRTHFSLPIIILSAREASIDKVKGLELGADDYLAKPFSLDELIARIEALRRRLMPAQEREITDSITLGAITLNRKKHLVIVDGEEIALTRIEWLLLSELTRHAGKLMLYEDLLSKIWGPEYRNDVQILRTWISRLRNKIERNDSHPAFIRTVAKTGYMIDLPVSEPVSEEVPI
ncbi:MAG: response regulator transcription factor [Dehalococcoidales bacterium]|nr:response regulator transcription factor [Dehalococcoidales bacterium]